MLGNGRKHWKLLVDSENEIKIRVHSCVHWEMVQECILFYVMPAVWNYLFSRALMSNGRSTRKRVPLPTSDRTVISPCKRLTIVLQIESPRPVPDLKESIL